MPGRSRLFDRALPPFFRAKLASREVRGVPREKIVSLFLPELVQQAIKRSRVVHYDRAHWVNAHLYDRAAARHVDGADVLHFVSPVGLHSARRAKKKGARVVCDLRMEHPDHQRRVLAAEHARLGVPYVPEGVAYDAKVKAEFAESHHFLVPSAWAKRTYVDEGLPADRIHVVPYGASTTPRERPPPDRFRVLFLGQVVPRKGPHHLVEAFAKARLADAELCIVGPIERPMRRALEARATGAVTITGEVPTVEPHYRAASCFVLPSVADAQPLVCLQAMSWGLPLVVTRSMGTSEIVRDGVEGFVVDAGDVDGLADRLARLHDDPALAARMGAAARERSRAYTWEAYGDRLVETYREIGKREGLL